MQQNFRDNNQGKQTHADHVSPRENDRSSSSSVRPKNVKCDDENKPGGLKEAGLFAVGKVADALLPSPEVDYDKEAGLFYIDDSLSGKLKRVGLFTVKIAAIGLTVYAVSQGLRRG